MPGLADRCPDHKGIIGSLDVRRAGRQQTVAAKELLDARRADFQVLGGIRLLDGRRAGRP
jgi:hypothetical protein